MKRYTVTLCSLVLLCCSALAQQDIYVNGKGPVVPIGTSLVWGSSGKGAVNNNFVFSPNLPQSNVCIYVVNNNPINPHSFTVQVFQSGDGTLRGYSTSSGRFVRSQSITSLSVAAASSVSVFANIGTASTVSVNISGSSTQAGSPDTADIYALATTSNSCSAAAVNAALTQFQGVSYSGSNTSYTATACITNPAANGLILAVDAPANGSIHSVVYWEKVRFSSTAAGQINVNRITDAGSICTAGVQDVQANLLPVAVGAQFLIGTCTTNPTVGGIISQEQVGATNPIELDLRGFYFPLNSGSLRGIDITTPAGITGTVCSTMYWSEQ